MTPEAAIAIGTEALVWLADRPDALARFMSDSGVGPAEIRAGARDPGFLGFLLDFVLGNEALARDFAAATLLTPDRLAAARRALPGGDQPHWT